MGYTLIVLNILRLSACPSGGTGRRTGLKILRDLNLVPVQVRPRAPFFYVGRLAQLVRAPALQAGGHRFESYIAHHFFADIA